MSNIGKRIQDFYCNGFAGRRYDLEGSTIEAESDDWLVIRTEGGAPILLNLQGWDKQEMIDRWTNTEDDDREER
jgi:hypothetical protein